jgi:hypothetical protein
VISAKKLVVLTCVLLVAPVLGLGCIYAYHARHIGAAAANKTLAGEAGTSAGGNKILALVNGKVIRESDLAALTPASHDEALGLLVDFALLDQEASRAHVEVSKSELEKERKRLVANQSSKSYGDASIKVGRTTNGMDLQLRHSLILKKLAARMLVGKQDRMFHARGILVKYDGSHAKTRALAQAFAKELQKKVEHGANIAALAKRDSDDKLSGPTGGDLGVISSFGAPNLVHQTLDFNMQLALSKQLGKAKAGEVLIGPVTGHVGYWILEIVSTQEDPRGEQELYNHVLSLYRSLWTTKYEPLEMMHLRASATIDPPLNKTTLSPQTAQTR